MPDFVADFRKITKIKHLTAYICIQTAKFDNFFTIHFSEFGKSGGQRVDQGLAALVKSRTNHPE